MPLDSRSKKILEELISNPSITSKDMEKKFQLTRRQLGYSFDKINDWLLTKNLPVIERTRQGHFVMDQSIFSQLTSEQETPALDSNILLEDQRVYIILMMLISKQEELSLVHFTSKLEMSKNTILHDLKRAQSFVDDYELHIRYSRRNGYVLEGKEFQIRKLLLNVTFQLLDMVNGESWLKDIANIQTNELDELQHRIEKVENKLNLKFTDEKMTIMPYTLILVLRRIKQGKTINAFSIRYEELSDTKEYQATEEILYDFMDIPLEERLFITLHLLTTNVYWSEGLTEDSIPNLNQALDDMLRMFEKNACIYLQDRQQLLNKLLLHVKPAYYRIKYNLTEANDVLDTVTNQFREVHHLVKQSTKPLADLVGSDIPDNETAYLTMLIGGWLTKQGENIQEKIKAIVVCPQGVSVSRLMFNELRELFPDFVFLDSLSVREFLNYSLDYDIVFSPIHLETDKKLFKANSFLNREEKQRLRKQVMLELHGYIPYDIDVDQILEIIEKNATIENKQSLARELTQYIHRDETQSVKQQQVQNAPLNLNDLITLETITLADSADSWQEAIRLSGEPLVKTKKIEPRYVEAVLHHCEKDPYIVIGPNIAIPHAAPDEGVNDVGMSLLRLEEGVPFTTDYSINFVIMIAAVDKQQHLRALMQLMNLAGNKEDLNTLMAAKTKEEIYNIITAYSAE
ncbi:BglG family transcription antiterminator [Oceanobacillus halotolerans]|uniref:BglG family transcription antiterminator n=1 Tax=Oceanobacillus halotolerans TaxID=2663380 RepID=UPI0013DC3AF8|nr:BglG family transcription antiterminator [Oceanobacillus halotolerans]